MSPINSISKTAIINIFEAIGDLFYSDRKKSVEPNVVEPYYHITAVTCNKKLPEIIEYILSHSFFFKQHPIISGAIAGRTIGLRL